MKARDNHPLFEIFQPGVRDDLSFIKKLGYWLKNVYWYHFKIHTLVALFVAIIATIFVCDVFQKVDNDLDFIVAGETLVSDEQLSALCKNFTKIVPDINRDEKVTVGYQMLCTASEKAYDELAAAAEQKLAVSFADDRFLLFILDQEHMEALAAQGAFEPLESFDIKADNRFCVRIDDSPLFQKLGIPKPEQGWYIGIKMINEARANDEEIMKKYHAAANMIEELTNRS